MSGWGRSCSRWGAHAACVCLGHPVRSSRGRNSSSRPSLPVVAVRAVSYRDRTEGWTVATPVADDKAQTVPDDREEQPRRLQLHPLPRGRSKKGKLVSRLWSSKAGVLRGRTTYHGYSRHERHRRQERVHTTEPAPSWGFRDTRRLRTIDKSCAEQKQLAAGKPSGPNTKRTTLQRHCHH